MILLEPRRKEGAFKRKADDCASRGGSHFANRYGTLLVEMVVCCMLLSTVAVVLTPIVRKVQQQQTMARFETLALTAVNNTVVDLRSGMAAGDCKVDDWFLERYPDAELSIETLQQQEIQTSFRITIRRPGFQDDQWQSRSVVIWQETQQ